MLVGVIVAVISVLLIIANNKMLADIYKWNKEKFNIKPSKDEIKLTKVAYIFVCVLGVIAGVAMVLNIF